MAKDKTRERKLPDWVKQRSEVTVRMSEATRLYYGLAEAKFVSWFNVYGAFRQGAKVRA
jgi:hypothetical protein